MGKLHSAIDDAMRAWIEAQRLFFVATAPSEGGHINCSPKGGEPLLVLGPSTVAYVDRVGSGIETAAHLRQNGRIVIMLCAFDGAPRIVRLHGQGRVFVAGSEEFEQVQPRVAGGSLGVRSLVRVELSRISDSCGFGVPFYRFEGEREQMRAWAAKKGPEGVAAYVRDKNAVSIDGLPGLPLP